MSKPKTYEMIVLSECLKVLTEYSNDYERQIHLLEMSASLFGNYNIFEYWDCFYGRYYFDDRIESCSKVLISEIKKTEIFPPLVISALARERVDTVMQKKDGAFYTDFRLALEMASMCNNTINPDSKVVDLASGSGILLAAIACDYYAKYPKTYCEWLKKCVYAYDLSENALRGARIALSCYPCSVDVLKEMSTNWGIGDSLIEIDISIDNFDIVIGNPPWGKVKLSHHTYIKQKGSRHIYGSNVSGYGLENYSDERKASLEYSKAIKKKYSLIGQGEVDIYMAFLQRALQVLKEGGLLVYLVPAGLIRSQGTEKLREYLLKNTYNLKYILINNKPNFFSIDSRFKFLLLRCEKGENKEDNSFTYTSLSFDGKIRKYSEEICFDINELKNVRPNFTIPEVSSLKEKDLFFKVYLNGIDWTKRWKFDIGREIDMTNDRELFRTQKDKRSIPVIEGRMVQQHRFGAKTYVSGEGRSAQWEPCLENANPHYYVDESMLSNSLLNRIKKTRAGYCDIAGQTNERAMMSAVIPPNVVCGNKVPTIVFDDINKMLLWIGVVNSFVFDWMLRRVISTTVNYFLLYSIPMPDIEMDSDIAHIIISNTEKISRMRTEFYLSNEMSDLRAEIDVAVAMAYGLSFADLQLVLLDFPLLDRKQLPLAGESVSTVTRDKVLSVAEKRYNVNIGFRERAAKEYKIGAKSYIPTEMFSLCKGVKMDNNQIGIKLIIWKKIVEGDLSKFTATSNLADTGGGARDLRFSPASEFYPAFQRMFDKYDNTGMLRGFFTWDNHPKTEVFIHPTTNSRPNEVRIATVHKCFPATVIPNDARDCILVIVMDSNNIIHPYFTSQYSLQYDNWHPYIKESIISGLQAKRSIRTTAMGIIDIEKHRRWTNGQ